MKRYLIPILIILVLSLGLVMGCGTSPAEDKLLDEEQVIQMTYDYLTAKAGQLQGAQGEKIIIGWAFRNAVFAANKEALDENNLDKLGDLVDMQFSKLLPSLRTPAWTGALEKLARYQGDGLWSVSIEDWEWELNERTGEVTAQNEEATKLLEEISHCIYHSNMYGYRIDYPAGWTVTEVGDEGQILIVAHEPQVDIAVDKPRRLEPGESLGDYASGFAAFLSMIYQDFELISLVQLEGGDYQMDFEWILGGTEIHTRTNFILQEGSVYMITGSAPKSTYESYLDEFDYAYNSFRFD